MSWAQGGCVAISESSCHVSVMQACIQTRILQGCSSVWHQLTTSELRHGTCIYLPCRPEFKSKVCEGELYNLRGLLMQSEIHITPIIWGSDPLWISSEEATVILASSCCLLTLVKLRRVDYSFSKRGCRYPPEWLLHTSVTDWRTGARTQTPSNFNALKFLYSFTNWLHLNNHKFWYSLQF